MTALDTPASAALDPRLYVDPVALEREQEAIFARSWQLAGHVADVAAPGSYLTARVGAESVLVVRGDDGELRAFRNVCRHRATQAARGPRRLRQGDALPLPRLDLPDRRQPDRRPGGARLRRPRQVGARRCCRPAPRSSRGSCSSRSTTMPRRCATSSRASRRGSRRTAIDRLTRFSESSSAQPANWKIVADNYLEGYHIPIAHPGLMRLLDYQRYDGRGGGGLRLVRGAAARQAVGQPARAGLPADGAADARARRLRPRASGATSTSIRTRRSTSIPTRSRPGRSRRTGRAHARHLRLLPRGPAEHRDARRAAPQPPAQHRRGPGGRGSRRPRAGRDGHARLAARPARRARGGRRLVRRPRAARPGVRRVRHPHRRRRARAHPRRRLRRDRRAGHRGRPDRADRDHRGRLSGARALPLRHPRGTARRGARALLRAARQRPHDAGRGAGLDVRAAARLDDRPVASVPGAGRPRVAPVARAVGQGGAPARAPRASQRGSTSATTPGSPRRSRRASTAASSAPATPAPSRSG